MRHEAILDPAILHTDRKNSNRAMFNRFVLYRILAGDIFLCSRCLLCHFASILLYFIILFYNYIILFYYIDYYFTTLCDFSFCILIF